jgi:hypothetical protein
MRKIVEQENEMKDISLLVWLTQLGISVAMPPACFILLAVWLRSACGWGEWVIYVGVAVGAACAVSGFRNSLKAMELLSRDKKEKQEPPVCFNDHD